MSRILFVVVMLSVTSIASQPIDAAETVALRERVAMTAPVVRLGDVAEIVSADRQRTRQLAALPLMPSPSPGSARYLRRREVEDLLSAHGQNLQQLRVEGAEQVAISGPATTPGAAGDIAFSPSGNNQPMNLHAAILASETGRSSEGVLDERTASALRNQLQTAIESYLRAKTNSAGPWQVSCNIPAVQLAQLRDAASPIACQGGCEPWTGRQRFTVSFSSKHGVVQFPIYAQVSGGPTTVVVAVQPIARGATITAADVELQNLASAASTSSRRAPIDSIDKLIGMVARRAIQSGETIFSDHVQAPTMVKRGDMITVVSQGGGIRVRTTALARQDGAKGELVQVESQGTGERFDARVTGPREATVFVAGGSTPSIPREPLQTWATAPRMPQPPSSATPATARR
jgi:flagella basal body P-ring formation protein FlgA